MAAGIAGAAAPASTMDALGAPGGGVSAPDAGVDQERAQLVAYMGELRDLDTQVKDTLAKLPALQPFMQQWASLFSKIVQGTAKTAPQQTGSAMSAPTAGQ